MYWLAFLLYSSGNSHAHNIHLLAHHSLLFSVYTLHVWQLLSFGSIGNEYIELLSDKFLRLRSSVRILLLRSVDMIISAYFGSRDLGLVSEVLIDSMLSIIL